MKREAALELGVGAAQGRLGIDLEMARQIGDGEQDVADLVRDGAGGRPRRAPASISPISSRILASTSARVVPVEADGRGLRLQLHGAGEARAGRPERRRAGPSALGARRRRAPRALGLLLSLDLRPTAP